MTRPQAAENPATKSPTATVPKKFDIMDNGKLRGFELPVRKGVQVHVHHSLNGVLVYERDVKAYKERGPESLEAVHVRGPSELRAIAAYFLAVADHEERVTKEAPTSA